MGRTGYHLDNGWILFSGRGLRNVSICNNKEGDERIEIEIPEELLLCLAAEQVRSAKISQLEQMSDNQILGLKV